MRHLSWVLTLSSLILVTSASAAPLVVNGGFETPVAPGSYFTQYGGGSTGITGWTVTGNDVLIIDKNYTETGSGGTVHFTPQEGNQSLDITGAGNTGLADGVMQSIATVVGQRYSLSFYVGRTDATPDDPRYSTPSIINLAVGGISAGPFTNSSITAGAVNWRQFTYNFTATSASTSIAFTNGTAPVPVGNNFAGLDNVSVTAVPGPASLVSFGVMGLGMLRRSRRTA